MPFDQPVGPGVVDLGHVGQAQDAHVGQASVDEGGRGEGGQDVPGIVGGMDVDGEGQLGQHGDQSLPAERSGRAVGRFRPTR